MNQRAASRTRMRSRIYEITFAGHAGPVLRAEFDDCEVTADGASTTLRAELPDQAALWGLVQRITGLGFDVTDMHLVTRPSKSWQEPGAAAEELPHSTCHASLLAA